MHVRLCPIFATPWTTACQAPLSMEFSRQEYWSGLPFPTPGNLPNPGIKHTSPVSPELAGRLFTTETKAFDCVDHNKLWKKLQETGIPDHLPCLLRNLCAGQEATVTTGHGTTGWFQIGKGVRQGCILSPSLPI